MYLAALYPIQRKRPKTAKGNNDKNIIKMLSTSLAGCWIGRFRLGKDNKSAFVIGLADDIVATYCKFLLLVRGIFCIVYTDLVLRRILLTMI